MDKTVEGFLYHLLTIAEGLDFAGYALGQTVLAMTLLPLLEIDLPGINSIPHKMDQDK